MSKLRTEVEEHKAELLILLIAEHERAKRLETFRDRIEASHAIDSGRVGNPVVETSQDAHCPLLWLQFHNKLTSFINIANQYPPPLAVLPSYK